MNRMKRKKTKSQISEEKGDKDFKKGKFKKALAHYREAQKLDPGKTVLYDKLVEAHKKAVKKWTREDFSSSLEWTMKKQELENPSLKKVHERMDPDAAKKALLETLLALKKSMKKSPQPPFSKGGESDPPL